VVWTDDNGKLDYDRSLESMVHDARMILSREVRHSILKITGGDDGGDNKEPAAGQGEPDDRPAAVSDDLHARHVDAEQHIHGHDIATPVDEPADHETLSQPLASSRPPSP
jgi:glycerol-3-phosphate O-acyltransferase